MLRCPTSGLPLSYIGNSINGETNNAEGTLVSEDGKYSYPVINGIPRFVDNSNYAENFGKQWNLFKKTQLDSHSGHPISANRFWNATGWEPAEIRGKWVLDIGCGAGRFAEIALEAGARVIALDYSNAVDACKENLSKFSELYPVQGDIYSLPLVPEAFSHVYSLGVLQHTPQVESAFKSLPPLLIPGGKLCTDYYWKRFRTMLHAKYLVRPVTKRMDNEKLLKRLQKWAPVMLAISRGLGKVPLLGVVLKRLVPVADYTGRYPLSEKQLREWALLDTFDMLAPEFDNPQSMRTVTRWFRTNGFSNIEVFQEGHLVGRGIRQT